MMPIYGHAVCFSHDFNIHEWITNKHAVYKYTMHWGGYYLGIWSYWACFFDLYGSAMINFRQNYKYFIAYCANKYAVSPYSLDVDSCYNVLVYNIHVGPKAEKSLTVLYTTFCICLKTLFILKKTLWRIDLNNCWTLMSVLSYNDAGWCSDGWMQTFLNWCSHYQGIYD